MRKRMARVLACGMALALAVGCASKGGQPQAGGGGQTSEGNKEVAIALPYATFDSWDPHYWTSQLLLAQGTIREGLFGYNEKLEVVPKIAEKWEVNSDYTVWTFYLRKDKKWANGDPVTARDFYEAWMLMLSPEKKDTPLWAGAWSLIKNATAYKAGAAKKEEVGIKLLDDYTIRVELIRPHATWLNSLVMAQAMPIHHKILQEHPQDWWDPKYNVFNGPFVVKEWVKGGETVLVRNPNYVGEKYGNVTKITLKPFTDPNARLQAFENGEIQFSFLDDTAQREYVLRNPKLKEGFREELDWAWQGIQFNRADNDKPFDDIRVRQAFAMAIDKQALTEKILKGAAVPATAFSGDPNIADKTKPLPYDVARAKQLLAEAGYPDGKGFPEVTFYAPPANDGRMPLIEAIAKMWQDNLGVKVRIENLETGPYSTMQWAHQNKNIRPGFTLMGGSINWIEPMGLYQNVGHIWWFMDKSTEWKTKHYWEFQQRLDEANKVEKVGDFAALEKKAADLWANRQKIIAAENNEWGKQMALPPTFKDQFDRIAARFKEAQDDKAKLAAYKDALTLILNEERSQVEYQSYKDSAKAALRLMATLDKTPMKDVYPVMVQLNQMALDSAWQVPIYVRKVAYVVDPKLSGVVLNKLAWGNIFLFNYLKYGN